MAYAMQRASKGWVAVWALVILTSAVMLWQGVSTSLSPVPAETPPNPTANSLAPAEGVQPAPEANVESAEIVVHVAGAVKKPGVVRVPRGSRVDDAVRAAGGFSSEADADSINLAQPLEDGVQVYVPRKNQQIAVPGRIGGTERSSVEPQSVQTQHGQTAGKLNINTATAEQLESLPGVGPVTARAIVEYRKQNGIFRSVDDLLEVRGIGPKRLEQIRPYVIVR